MKYSKTQKRVVVLTWMLIKCFMSRCLFFGVNKVYIIFSKVINYTNIKKTPKIHISLKWKKRKKKLK